MNCSLAKNKKKSKISLTKIVLTSLFMIFMVLVGIGAVFYGQLGPAYLEAEEEQLFIIERGTIPSQIALDLKEQGLIKNKKVFLLYARLTGKLNKFKAGQYLLTPSLNIPEITDKLVEGKVATTNFTIPEGYTLRQIAEVLANKGIAEEEEFWQAAKEENFDYPFLQGLPKNELRLEGFLFPDTYTIPKGMEVEKILDIMLKRFNEVYENLPANKGSLSIQEAVTLASIVEGEAVVDEERPIIASVFYNRLKIKMRLQSDATVQYAFKERKKRVLLKDLEIESAYNTYQNSGLPPGPIGSPGEASLRAVMEPAETDYLYFVATKDGSGEHLFAKTLTEHNRNKARLGYYD